ncbi:MAG: NUDIX domain-containing protein [Candidatus Calescibacterium sp.]|nr:NUDIX domain-containing protein [Candidatus Calescibacterium sp.]MCX7733885.1 NUDIX domain-containing protein [bacterium]MDW8086666.1 NUDIX domain-containing protein [Candidatus Calescibacterium sp.]
MRREFSAGGIVYKDGKVLMIKVKTLSGKYVWTFPKGHIEKGEKKEEAAIREVEEETGVRSEIKKDLGSFTYYFKDKDGVLVKKTVFWYLMEPLFQAELKTPGEVLEVKWIDIKEAEKIISYDSDRTIIGKISREFSI